MSTAFATEPTRADTPTPAADAPQPRRMQTSRGPVEYVDAGRGPVLLALHGAMGGWDQSLLLTRTVVGPPGVPADGAPGYRTVAVSRPGYLGTPLTAGRDPAAQADLLAGLLDALGIGRVCVMAVSGGGYSGLTFALRHPDRCWGLALFSTTATRVTQRLPFAFHLLRLFGRTRWFAAGMQRRMAKDPDAPARNSIPDPDLRARTLAHPEAGPLFRELNAGTSSRLSERLAGTLNDVAVTRTHGYPLEELRVPTLVVHGGADRIVPYPQHGQVLAARIPGAELVTAPDGDHVFIYTHHDLVKPRVTAFLARHAPAEEGQTTGS